jgi:N-acetylneuraminic acid mutarotase
MAAAMQAAPLTLLSQHLFGGAGDQAGMGIAVGADGVYVAGLVGIPYVRYDDGLAAYFAFPLPASPTWTQVWPSAGSDYFTSVALGENEVYVSGASNGPAVVDLIGGKERKGVTVKYPPGGGGLVWQKQTPRPVAFPGYDGEEGIYQNLRAVEGGASYFYITGASQASGASGGRPYLSKLDTAGNTIWTVGDATTGSFGEGRCVATLNGNVYLGGHSVWDGPHAAPYLRKFTPSGGLVWEKKGSSAFGVGVFGGYFGMTVSGGFLFAAGQRADSSTGAPRDFLVEKWDESGNRLWSRVHDRMGGVDVFTSLVAVGNRLFAAGYTTGGTAGGKDGVIAEVDPATGDLLSTTLFGGTANDEWNGIATDGRSLYVVGDSASFTQGGNLTGQYDGVMARYSLISSITVSPAEANLTEVGQAVQFSATASFGDGSSRLLDAGERWDPLVSMPTARNNLGVAVLNGNIHVLGDSSAAGSRVHEVFDPVSGSWSARAPGPVDYIGDATAVFDGRIHWMGGYGDGGRSHYIFTPSTNSWTAGQARPDARWHAVGATIGRKFYLAGGWNHFDARTRDTLEAFDVDAPSGSQWSTKRSMGTPRYGAAVGAIGGKLYVAGGLNANTGWGNNVLEAYDPATDTWSVKTPMPTARGFAATVVLDGRLYVMGGTDYPGGPGPAVIRDVVEVYDPVTDAWSSLLPLPAPRSGAAGAVVDGRIYLFGGTDGTAAVATSFRYSPSEVAWLSGDPSVATVDAAGIAVVTGLGTCEIQASAGGVTGRAILRVGDSVPPVFTNVPDPVTVEADTLNGSAAPLPPPTVQDNVDPNPALTNDAPSVLPLGTWTITWTATDAAGNTAIVQTQVTVVDTQPPVFVFVPGETIVEQTSFGGAQVILPKPVAVDTADAEVDLRSEPPSGSVFPLGTTIVRWFAIDDSGHSAEAETTVVVRDSIAPTLACVNVPDAPGAALQGQDSVRPPFSFPQGLARPYDRTHNLAWPGNGFARPAVARDDIPNHSAIHQGRYVNDGDYGNGASWIGNSADSWVKIDLGRVESIDRFYAGRDRTGYYDDRDWGRYRIFVALQENSYANGDESNDASEYALVFDSANAGFSGIVSGSETIRAAFAPVDARYVKIIFQNYGACVDEIEIHRSSTCEDTVTLEQTSVAGAVVNLAPPAGTDLCDAGLTYQVTGLPQGNLFPPGATVVTYRAQDDSGNVSEPFTRTVVVLDTQPPGFSMPEVSENGTLFSDPSAVLSDGASVSARIRVQDSGSGIPGGASELRVVPGTAGLWHFSEGAGQTTSDSTGANTGSLFGSPAWTNGKLGSALRFNGVDQFVQLRAGPILGSAPNFTVEAWVRWDGLLAGPLPDGRMPSDHQFIYCEGSFNDIIDLYLNRGVPSFTVLGSNWVTASAAQPLPVGEWHHLAAVLQAGVGGKLYVDGTLAAHRPEMLPGSQGTASTDIGRFAGNGSWRHFHGTIDEVRVLSVARGQAEIQADFAQGQAAFDVSARVSTDGGSNWIPVPAAQLAVIPTGGVNDVFVVTASGLALPPSVTLNRVEFTARDAVGNAGSAAFTVQVGNTAAGTDVTVLPVDAATGTSPASVRFTTVTQPGLTSLSILSNGPPPPPGYRAGTPSLYYDLSTTAVFGSPVHVCIDYSAISLYRPDRARLFHYENGAWVDVTVSNDVDARILCGQVGSFSLFAVFEPVNLPPIAMAGPDQVRECAGPAGTPVVLDGGTSIDPDDDPLNYVWSGSFGTLVGPQVTAILQHGPHVITLTVTDPEGASSFDQVVVNVADTTPPQLTVPAPLVVEQTNRNGTPVTLPAASATDVCDPSPTVTVNAPPVFPLGETIVTYTAVDASGNETTATTTVTVVDTSAPLFTSSSAPILAGAILTGGAGGQRGTGVAVSGGRIFVAGHEESGTQSIATAYSIPPANPLWSTRWPVPASPRFESFNGVTATPEGVYFGGSTDRFTSEPGGHEAKGVLAKYSLGGPSGPSVGGTEWYSNPTHFTYGGTETYTFLTTNVEGGVPYIYALGYGEPASYQTYLIAKYSIAGALLARATESTAGISFGSVYAPSPGGATAPGAAFLNGRLYAAGGTAWQPRGDYGGRAVIWKYDTNLQLLSEWKDTSMSAWFRGIVAMGGHLYAVGHRYTVGVANSDDYLVRKYDESGNILWTRSSGGASGELLYGVTAVGNRLFAVGFTRSRGAGGTDMAILEIDPATGDTLSETLYGGPQDDVANGVATDGTDLYVVGESRSFAQGGNAVGQNDIVLLRYTIAGGVPAPVIAEQTSPSGAAVALPLPSVADVCDAAPVVTSDAPAVFLPGTTLVTFTVRDASGNTRTATTTVTVQDSTAPTLSLPADATVEQQTNAGTAVTFAASATDAGDPAPTVAYSHPPGSVFPLGTTMVTATATDGSGNQSVGTFRVTVRDTTPPTFVGGRFQVEADIPLPVPEGGASAVNPVTRKLYVVDGFNGGSVWVVDTAGNRFLRTIGTRGYDFDIRVNPVTNRIYVPQQFAGVVRVIDGATDAVIEDIPIPSPSNDIGYIAVDTVRNRLYQAAANVIVVVDAAGVGNHSMSQFNSGLPLGHTVLEVDSVRRLLYATMPSVRELRVFDADTFALLRIIPLTHLGRLLSVNTTTGRVYVGSGYAPSDVAGRVTVLDGPTGSLVQVVSVAPTLSVVHGLVVDELRNRWIVSGNAGDPIGVYDGATNQLLSTSPMPPGRGTSDLTYDAQNGQLFSSAETVLSLREAGGAPPVVVEQTSRAGTPVALATPGATDLCDAVVTVTRNGPSVFPLGTTTVTWTALDDSGNAATTTQAVTVVDTTPPALVAPAPLVVEQTDRNGTALGVGGWVPKRGMPTPRRSLHAAAVGDKIYAVGGFINGDTPIVEEYDTRNDTWRAVASLPNLGDGNAGRYQGSMVELNGRLWMVGGWRTNPPLPTRSLQVYDPVGNSWSQAAPYPTLSGCSGSGVINGKIYTVTVCDGFSGYRKTLFVYDPVSNGWTRLTDIPRVHAGELAVAAGGRLYIIGGNSETGVPLRDVDIYDPVTNLWTAGAPMPTGRVELAGGVIDGKLFAAGGWDGTGGLNVVEIYDPVADRWTTGDPLPAPRWSGAGAVVGGRLYIVGGYDGTANVGTLDVLDSAGGLLAVASDICDSSPVVTSDAPATFPLGTTTVRFTARDASGNISTASTTVTVVDTTPPQIGAAPPIVVEQATLAGTPLTLLPPSAADICDASPVVTSNAPAVFPLGMRTVTWTATDDAGNTSTSTQTVTVVDTTAPQLAAPPPIVVEQTNRDGTPVTLPLAAVFDACDAAPVLTSDAPATFPLGTTTVTFTATDISGHSTTATTTVTVVDTTPPAFTLGGFELEGSVALPNGGGVTGVNPATGKLYVVRGNPGGGAVHVIDGATRQLIRTIGTQGYDYDVKANRLTNRIYVPQQFARQLRVIDGVTDTVIEDIPIPSSGNDIGAIAIDEPGNRVYQGAHGWMAVVDASGMNPHAISTFDPGLNGPRPQMNPATARLYVMSPESTLVKVYDTTTSTQVATIPLDYPWGRAAIDTVANRLYVSSYGSPAGLISVIDGATNQVVRVIDASHTFPGVILALAVDPSRGRVFVAGQGTGSVLAVYDGATGQQLSTRALRPPGYSVADMAYDEVSGRLFVTHEQGWVDVLKVGGFMLPVVVEQADRAGTAVALAPPAATDICDANPTVTRDGPAVFPLGTTVVTWTVRDISGNRATVTQPVTVVDTTPPQITPPDPIVVEQTDRNGTPATLPLAAVFDACDAAPVVTSDAPATFPLGTTTVTFTATDVSGHSTTATTTVTVVDTTPPVLATGPAGSAGLVGYWPFDGNGSDASGNGRDLNLFGGVGFASGLFGQALDLHHDPDQYAARPVDDDDFDFGDRDFSLQVWVNFNDTSGEQEPLEKFAGQTGPGWTVIKLGDGTLIFTAHPNGVTSPPQPIPTQAWHHLFFRRQGTNWELFFNGRRIAQAIIAVPVPDTDFPLLIGKRNSADGRNFAIDGRIDEVAIWNRPLSDSEIAQLYNGGVGSPAGGGGGLAGVTVEQTSRDGTPVALPAPTASDVCDADIQVTSDAPGVFPLGTTTVKWTAVDDSGNRSILTQTVTVLDRTPPQVTAPAPVTVEQTDRNGTSVDLPSLLVMDVCDSNPMVLSDALGVYPLGTTTVKYTVTDASGNVTVVTTTVTVRDTTAPVLVGVPGPITVEQTDRDGTPVAVPMPVATDICDASPLVRADGPGGAGGSTGVTTWTPTTPFTTARNRHASVVSGEFVYVIAGGNDRGVPPLSDVQAARIQPDGALGPWMPTTPLPETRQDHAAVVHQNRLYVLGGFGSAGVSSEVLSARINPDGTLGPWMPTTPLPDPQYEHTAAVIQGHVYVVGGGMGGGPFFGFSPKVYHAPIQADGSLGAWRTGPALPSGRAYHASVAFNQHVYVLGGVSDGGMRNDVLSLPVAQDGTPGVWRTEATQFSDVRHNFTALEHQGSIYVMGGAGAPTIWNDVQYAPIDAAGRVGIWSQTTPFAGPRYANAAVARNGRLYVIGGWNEQQVFDDVQYSAVQGGSGGGLPTTFPLGTTTIRFTATDASGNSSTAETMVTVVDTTPPQMTLPADVVVEQTNGAGTPVAVPAPIVSDICDSNPTVSSDAAGAFPLGTTRVTFTATDASGNSVSASMVVTVVDTTPPTITDVPAPITVEQTSGAGATVNLPLPTASDLCDASPTVSSDALAVFPLGTTVVTFLVRDASGNEATATTTVTVEDTTAPVLSNVPASFTLEQTQGAGTPYTLVPPTVSDVCDAGVTFTHDAPAVFPLGDTLVTFTATDGSGNSVSISMTVTVVDTTPSVLTGVPGPLVVVQNHALGATFSVPAPEASDVCDAAPILTDDAPAVFPLGTTIVTFTATDASGNSSTAQTTVTVEIAPATALVVSGFPSPQTARVPGAFSVSAVNAFGTRDPRYQGTVAFSSSDPLAQLPAPYAFQIGDGGLAFFSAVLHSPSLDHVIAATDLGKPGIAGSQTGIVLINLPPIADPQAVALDEDTSVAIALTGSDAEGAPLTFSVTVPPSRGVLSGSAPNLVYTPFANINGSDFFEFVVGDGVLSSAPAAVILDVRPVNDPPVAAADAYVTDEDVPLVVPAAGVLANDSDIDPDALTAILVTAPAHGVLALNLDGSFTYTPNPNYNGPDAFSYRASDGLLDSAPITVGLTILPVNDAPVAAADAYFVDKNTPLVVSAPGVLSNDTDVESDPLTVALVAAPATGALVFAADGSFTYTPVQGFTGVVSFTYRANDGALDSGVSTVTLTVTSPNNRPTTHRDAYGVFRDTTISVPSSQGVLANDNDVDGDALTALLVSGPSNGTLALNPNGSFTYTPTSGFTGADEFAYKASDGRSESGVETVTLSVTATNGAPMAKDDRYNDGLQDTTLVVPAAQGVLANDSDPESNPLSAVLVTPPSQGSLTLNPDGSLSYSPAVGFTGSVTFTYRASDGMANSALATVEIKVKK